MLSQIQNQICQLFFKFTDLPVFIINKAGKIDYQYKSIFTPDLSEETIKLIMKQSFSDKFNIMYMYECEKILVIPVSEKISSEAYLILWPNINLPKSNNIYKEFMPEMSAERLGNSGKLLYYALFNQLIDSSNLKSLYVDDNGMKHVVKEKDIIEEREYKNFHKSYLSESDFFKTIEDGDIAAFDEKYSLFLKTGVYGKLSNSELRGKKNLIIAATTLATRAAIRGGLYNEKAYTLSDQFIRHVESLTSISNMALLIREICEVFLKQVCNSKRSNISRDVYHCEEYIYNHLYEKISLEQLSGYVSLNKSYLSDKFKKETGKTITEYVMFLKVEEAKRILVFSDKDITSIYTLLGFNDQSHFTKVFKKYVGKTPFQYRRQYLL